MRDTHRTRTIVSAAVMAAALAMPAAARGQNPSQTRQRPAAATQLGLDVFGGAGVTFPAAKDTFDAVGLKSTPFDVGGGARVTGLWRNVFVQVSGHQWSDSGERAFVDAEGTVFPLGIPLDVRATFIDATIGVKEVVSTSGGRVSLLAYVGAGGGVVRYKEQSPFAQEGDDLNTTKPSYNFLLGVEVPIAGGLALALDGRYRHIPGILGDEGASAILGEETLGGFQTSVALRFGFGGRRIVPKPPGRPAPTPGRPAESPVQPAPERLTDAIIAQAAPVFLLPDATRTPLRTLPAGTPVRILEEAADWLRIEFTDAQYGRRVGFVQRRFVRSGR